MKNEKQLRVFVAVNDMFTLRVYEKHLMNKEIPEIALFLNGYDCINYLHKNPDIIFLDYDMDLLSDFQVLRKIKWTCPDTSVIMLLSHEGVTSVLASIGLGALDCIMKGNNEEKLIGQVIDRICQGENKAKKDNPSFPLRFDQSS